MVVEKLYELFKNDNWKVRWVAASLVLKMSDTSQIPEFMSKLGQAEGLAITEPLSYGGLISDLKGSPPPGRHRGKVFGGRKFGSGSPYRAQLLLFSRTAADAAKVEAYAKDAQPHRSAKPTPRNVSGSARCRAQAAMKQKRSRPSASSWNSASSPRWTNVPRGARSRACRTLTLDSSHDCRPE